jgi:hypothetical protein
VLAAAAVAAIGFGATQMLDTGSSEGDSAGGSSDSSVTRDGAGDSEAEAAAPEKSPPPSSFALDGLGVKGLEPIDPRQLSDDLAALDESAENAGQARSARRLADVCGPRRTVPGSRVVAATYDDRPTLAVYLPPEDGSRRVDLYLCDTDRPRDAFRSVTLPAGE